MVVEIQSNVPKNEMRIEMFLSDYCNYSCWYCSDEFHSKKVKWPDINTLLPNFLHMLEAYKRKGKKKFNIFLGGGEPTLWPDLISFIKAIKKDYDCCVSLHSNCSRTLRWWEQNSKYFDHVGMSVHHEKADVKHLSKVGDILFKNKVALYASVLMDPGHWDKCVEIAKELKKSKRKWLITTLQVHYPNLVYTDEQKKYLNKRVQRHSNPFYSLLEQKKKEPKTRKPTLIYSSGTIKYVDSHWLLLNGYNNFEGWECWVGVETVFVDKKGYIKGSCGNTIYNKTDYFNLYDADFMDKFEFDLEPTICNTSRCICQPEVNCTKRKINESKYS